MTKLLELQQVSISFFRGKTALRAVNNVDLVLHSGEILGLVGESGSGKSLLMKSVLGILPQGAHVTGGHIMFEGKDLATLSEKAFLSIRGRRIAMIFQDPMTALNPLRTIGYHVIEVLHRFRSLSGEAAKEVAVELLKDVGIPDPVKRLDQYPHEFSGGMRQRVMIALALAAKPDIIIADEPTTALDVTIQAQILDLLESIRRERGTSIILITHDLGVIASRCDRVAVMYGGRVLERGTVEDIFYEATQPYTQALLSAIARVDAEKTRLTPIPGSAPALWELGTSCPFYERCTVHMERCRGPFPDKTQHSPSHSSYCHRHIVRGEHHE
ncbi:ABC transporter ATP-binding protein [Peptoniphilus equinus]|uniref:ABC transporter ATP-binding protein n=1 Tax=Peptoniphilus equinus TaxID=3016343 RepID=A0ABY7QT72_9FIRM|nr:ABC transporter ATP-binding protein [Peptoniphilus equinus]WBW49932.1 ABC transporter ATP-binding protein [Peptoniphilus equinus]